MEKYTREQLEDLSEDQYIEMILRQQEIIEQQQKQIRQLQRRVDELEQKLAELKKPSKDSSNSSTPPSQDQKENKESDADQEGPGEEEGKADMGLPEEHEGTSRENQQPDLSIDQQLNDRYNRFPAAGRLPVTVSLRLSAHALFSDSYFIDACLSSDGYLGDKLGDGSGGNFRIRPSIGHALFPLLDRSPFHQNLHG